MSMRKIVGLFVVLFLAASAQAQLFRAPARVGRAVFTGPELLALPQVELNLTKQVYAAARANFSGPQELLQRIPRSLVAIGIPNHSRVLGSGFLFQEQGKLFVATAYHIGGKEGNTRVAFVFDEEKGWRAYPITIAVSGNAGWHSADIAIAELPPQVLEHGARPLLLGTAQVPGPAYSFGYSSGDLDRGDILPMVRQLVTTEGFGMQGTRSPIEGEDPTQPFLVSGYCGAPVLQKQDGVWKAVGLHVGAEVQPGSPEQTRNFAVNVSRVAPFLLDEYGEKTLPVTRGLLFNNVPVDRLAWHERVKEIYVLRDGGIVFQVHLRNFPEPYADEHSELAVSQFDWKAGDVVRYVISDIHRRIREVDFVIRYP